jgi:hypothetical protein
MRKSARLPQTMATGWRGAAAPGRRNACRLEELAHGIHAGVDGADEGEAPRLDVEGLDPA